MPCWSAGYASAFTSAIDNSSDASKVSDSTEAALTKSFDSASAIAQQNPQYASQITAAAKESFLSGDHWAYTAGIVAVLLGAALVATMFPGKDREREATRGVPRGGRGRRGRVGSELRRRAVVREHAKRLRDLQGPDAEGPRRRAGAPLRLSTAFVRLWSSTDDGASVTAGYAMGRTATAPGPGKKTGHPFEVVWHRTCSRTNYTVVLPADQ